jgi:hypothetical protein
MKLLKISTNGVVTIEEQQEDGITKIDIARDIKKCMNYEVEFESGLSFKTFFKLILKEKSFFNILFSEELNGYSLEELEKELKTPSSAEKNKFEINALEVVKSFWFFDTEIGGAIDLYTVFLGLGKTKEGYNVVVPTGLCFLNEIKDCEIFINNIVEINGSLGMSSEEYDSIDDVSVSFFEKKENDTNSQEVISRITLYDVIQSILFEVCFFKTHQEKINARKKQNSFDFKKNKINFLKKELEDCVKNDEFEKAADIKKQLEALSGMKK